MSCYLVVLFLVLQFYARKLVGRFYVLHFHVRHLQLCRVINGYLGDAADDWSFADGACVNLLASSQHVDDWILDERSKHKHETRRHPDVDRLRERDRREPALTGALRRDRQHREDAEGDASGHRLEVDPEGHPRQQDDQHAGQVRGQDVGAQATLQVEVGSDARVRAYTRQIYHSHAHEQTEKTRGVDPYGTGGTRPPNISRVISATFYPCNIFLISWKSFSLFSL